MQALSVAHLWDMPGVVLEFLMTGNNAPAYAAANAAANAATYAKTERFLLMSAAIAVRVLRELGSPGCAFLEAP